MNPYGFSQYPGGGNQPVSMDDYSGWRTRRPRSRSEFRQPPTAMPTPAWGQPSPSPSPMPSWNDPRATYGYGGYPSPSPSPAWGRHQPSPSPSHEFYDGGPSASFDNGSYRRNSYGAGGRTLDNVHDYDQWERESNRSQSYSDLQRKVSEANEEARRARDASREIGHPDSLDPSLNAAEPSYDPDSLVPGTPFNMAGERVLRPNSDTSDDETKTYHRAMRAAGAREDARREHMKTRRQIYNELRQEQASRTAALNEAAEASKNAGSSSRPWGRGGESRSRAW